MFDKLACRIGLIDMAIDDIAGRFAMRADSLLDAGDLDGVKAWATIRDRIVVLQGRVDSETAH